MKEILKLREKILKQDYLNSDIMKITEAISNLDDTNKKLSKDRKMKDKDKIVIINQEFKKIKNLIVNYTKKSKTIPLEIQQLEWVVNELLKETVIKTKWCFVL